MSQANHRTNGSTRAAAADRPRGAVSLAGWVRIVLGLFLLVAAGLKIHGFLLDPLSQDSFLASPRLLLVTIEVEILLGLWLVSGWWPRAAWVAALGFFTLLAAASLYLALAGQQSCGCLGRISVHPWLTFALDIAAVAGLLVGRPVGLADLPSVAWRRGVLQIGLMTAALLTLVGGAFVVAVDDPSAALARLRGEFIRVEPVISPVGDGVAGEERRFAITLTNHSDRPVRVIGGTTTCSCIVTADLPITVPPGESRSIEVQMTFRGGRGRFRHSFLLYTDAAKQPVVTAYFAGRVIEPLSR